MKRKHVLFSNLMTNLNKKRIQHDHRMIEIRLDLWSGQLYGVLCKMSWILLLCFHLVKRSLIAANIITRNPRVSHKLPQTKIIPECRQQLGFRPWEVSSGWQSPLLLLIMQVIRFALLLPVILYSILSTWILSFDDRGPCRCFDCCVLTLNIFSLVFILSLSSGFNFPSQIPAPPHTHTHTLFFQ